MKHFLFGILLLASICSRVISAPTPPYPHSTLIRDITWHWETYTNAALGSDLWPVTWGPDDNLYTAWGDGGGFGGGDHDGRVAMGFGRIEGMPGNWRGFNVNGGKNPEHPSAYPRKGKTGCLVCVNGVLYASVNLQDGVWPNVNHVLAWSTNLGATWQQAPWLFPRGAGSFQPYVFLNFGKDYSGVPAALAGYVYLYGMKHTRATNDDGPVLLARVATNQITDRAAYEFFQGPGVGAQPAWTSNVVLASPVFVDTNYGGICSVVYSPMLKRYLGASFGGPGQLGVFDAPNPWGPWTTVCYLEDFGRMGADGEGLVCTFPQKWMSADGLTLWTVFSCYGGSAKSGIYGHDRFNLVKATLQLY